MARKPKEPESAPRQSNSEALLAQFAGDIQRHLDDLDTLKGEYMQRCKSVREIIRDTYDRAGDSGLSKKALRARFNALALEKKLEAIRDDLEEDGLAEDYDTIRLALGDIADLPLGQAALKDAPNAPNPVDSLAGDDFDTVGAQNAAALASGIKAL